MRSILPLIMVLLVLGCSGSQELSMKDLRRGTNGLVLRLLDEQPPAKILENDGFVMTFELKNDGAASAANAVLAVGVPKEYIDVDIGGATLDGKPTNLQFTIEGKSLKNPNGDLSLLVIPAQAKAITTSKKQSVSLTAQLCYDYETIAEANVCVNYNPTGYPLRITPCKPAPVSFSSQGAPIAVTKIDVKPKYFTDRRLGSIFLITIQNKGTGRVVEAGQTQAFCSATAELTKLWDKVMVTVVLGGKEISCKKKVVRLENNKAEIICEGAVEQTSGPYVAPLQVYLDYGYTQTLSKQATIEHLA